MDSRSAGYVPGTQNPAFYPSGASCSERKEPLLLYITATSQVVCTVLTVELEEQGKAFKLQRPVYYISKVLTPSKQRYPHYQKLVYGIYLTAKKVAHYFQEHLVMGISDAPLSEIMNNIDATS